ncbi:L,D-transpeptidase [Streptomyces montanisoli]|uniref:L,D-transpeptidase family protein n=1 Tax=Streptomyces montanisoli TaxID=2798581 RepID=A0A940MG71_9ACTN|nr:Ig-like domain-containing protein [Streptomyces montanisoli]MBP0460288.1 L,D-transpeptidase family protein [Streptomyces montanisoli]
MNHTPRYRTVAGCTLLLASLGAGATACGGTDSGKLSTHPYDAADQISFAAAKDKKPWPLNKPLEITAKDGDGRITDVTAVDASGHHLAGELAADGLRWRSTAPLTAGTQYTVKVATEDGDGKPGTRKLSFDTAPPPSKKQLKVTFGPQAGEYGVGEPITAKLSAPVKSQSARAIVERSLKVTSVPATHGSWYWVDSTHLHYRPKEYWPTHATIKATSNLGGVKVDGKLYGGASKPLTVTTGDRFIAVTDVADHTFTVYRNGEEIKTIPVSTGKPGFDTRGGIKVVLEKQSFVQMRSATVGIAAGSSDSYDIPVHWATRVTWSGEYVHAAPWSAGAQGVANTSHGCTGMSTAAAEWYFDEVRPGDIVKVINSDGDMMEPFGNGFGDWNLSWAKWQKGSALNGSGSSSGAGKSAVNSDQNVVQASRLRPAV